MSRAYRVLVPVLALVWILIAFLPASTSPLSDFPVTVTDDSGRTITFEEPPQRIISLSPGHTETLFALGVGDRVVARDRWSDFPEEALSVPALETFPRPNVEALLAFQPDLIVVLVEQDDFIQQMEASGVKVLKLFPKDFEGTVETIRTLGRVTGAVESAEAIAADMRQRAEAVVSKVQDAPRPRVFYELDASDPARPWAAGPAGFYGSLIELAGGANIFADLGTTAAQVSTEQVVARDPEVILLGDTTVPLNPQTPEMVKERPGWEGITAVRQDAILPVKADLLARPGPRLVDGLEMLAKLLHPELFEE